MENCYTVGDSREVLSKLNDGSVDLVVTDPPYGIGYTRTHGRREKRPVLVGDTAREAPGLMREVVAHLARLVKPGGMVYVFCPGGRTAFRQGAALVRELETAFDIRNTLVWDKTAIGPGWYWRNQFEMIVLASRGSIGDNWRGGHSQGNVLRHKRVRTLPDGHPTPKPIDLVARLIEASSRPGDLVLDPFAGSGVTGAAAEQLGRRWVCVDLDKRWADEASSRYGLPVSYLEDSMYSER
jgi:DNA modification methylase